MIGREPRGGQAVMASRIEPPKSLEFFPTPPWATRALAEHVISIETSDVVWEPAAGEGHMAEVLREYAETVIASDVHDYGRGYLTGSFIGEGPDVLETPEGGVDWLITNPPFSKALEFYRRARRLARKGVALLLRTAWVEGEERFDEVFSRDAPEINFFSERVPMHKGRWEPDGSTKTSYAWFVWQGDKLENFALAKWIPPGQRSALELATDRERFAPSCVVGQQLEMTEVSDG